MPPATPASMERFARSWLRNWGIHLVLALLPDARVSQTLRFMVRAPRMRSSRPDVAAEICERTAQCGSRGGLDHKPWKRVRVGPARTELPNRRHSDEEQRAGCQKRGCLQGAGPNGKQVRGPGRRIASSDGKGAQSAGRGDHAFTGGLAVLQRGNEGRPDQSHSRRKRVSLLKRAIEIDPKFAMAYAHSAACMPTSGDRACGAECRQGL